VSQDLHLIPDDVYVYRLRAGSLTRTNEPALFGELQMLDKLKADPRFAPYGREIQQRLQLVLEDYSYFYRKHGQRNLAVSAALRMAWELPLEARSWRHLLAAILAGHRDSGH
jgi:hypothetical protein